ncbi:MAG TPA: nucleoside-diphosphate sugar epimerase/dehydratase [Thermodesulfobacteriota bacterium]|nr:nucleoside-diphosphate sugar epimerase/dehydratase [Thermodesulfobacteriota bacterium]
MFLDSIGSYSSKLSDEPLVRMIGTRYRRLGIAIVQLLLTVLAYVACFMVRFEFEIPAADYQVMINTLPMLIVIRLAAYYYFRLYSGEWQFVSMQDLINISRSIFWGSVIFLIAMVFVNRLQGYPRSIFLLEAIFNFILTSGIRFSFRFFHESKLGVSSKIIKHALIAGAGKAGVLVLNEIRTNRKLGIHVVGFIDDNSSKIGKDIQGVRVLGKTEDIPELAEKYKVDEVIITIPSAGYKDVMRITEIAHTAQIKPKVLPSLGRLIQEDGLVGQLKDISLDDLLGRQTIKFKRESDLKLIREEIKGRGVLVTGAGGSIGSELCRQVACFNPRLLILLDRYENSLYELELELKRKFRNQPILSVVGDILDSVKVNEILEKNRINLVYHAAAYKHVPLMEREPAEAVRNNVFGTLNVARLAAENHVDKFVLISTDKAVNPANIMGTTKRVSEMIVKGLGCNGQGTKFIAVRFGNVIGSNGSVIPIFQRQIAEGGPITITHPEVTRYFMSISEAVQLVMTAGAMGKGGEIFLLDMGEPIKVTDIATKLIHSSGLEPAKDVEIVFVGLRPGEKLHEELYWQGEGIVPTENKKITMLKSNGINPEKLFSQIEKLRECDGFEEDVSKMIQLLEEMVPEASISHDRLGHFLNDSKGEVFRMNSISTCPR